MGVVDQSSGKPRGTGRGRGGYGGLGRHRGGKPGGKMAKKSRKDLPSYYRNVAERLENGFTDDNDKG